MEFYEKTLNIETIYKGRIFDLETHTVELPDGKIAARDIIRNPGAAVIVPLTDNGEVIMVEQFRKPCEKTFIEVPAGKLEAGEDPQVCAARELKEETGYSAEKLVKILTLNPAPAFADEVLHIYLATGLTKGEASPDEGEFIAVRAYPLSEALNMIKEEKITDSKTVESLLYTAQFCNK